MGLEGSRRSRTATLITAESKTLSREVHCHRQSLNRAAA